MYASKYGHLEVVTLLLNSNANPNVKEKHHGRTALMYASKFGKFEVVQLLLELGGADVHKKDKKDGWTAFTYASEHGYSEIEELLWWHGNFYFFVFFL